MFTMKYYEAPSRGGGGGGGGGGGRQEKQYETSSSKTVELVERITNLLLKQKSDFRTGH